MIPVPSKRRELGSGVAVVVKLSMSTLPLQSACMATYRSPFMEKGVANGSEPGVGKSVQLLPRVPKTLEKQSLNPSVFCVLPIEREKGVVMFVRSN